MAKMCFNEITYQKANATVKNFVRNHPNELVLLKRYLAENVKVMQCLYVTLYPKYYSRNNKFDIQNKSLVDLTYWECFFFFLCGFSFTNIHESQDCRGRGRAFH